MSLLRHPLRFLPASLALGLLGAGALPAAEQFQSLAGLTYSGSQAILDDIDAAIAAAGRDPSKLAAIEKRLLAVLRRSDTTFAGRQWACQLLGPVLAAAGARSDAADLKPLAAMLVDERDSDIARLALERAPGPAVDTILLAALPKTSGRPRLGLIDTLARRQVGAAVPALARLLADPDAPTAAEAARALGALGTPEAETALRGARTLAPAVVAEARLAATARLPAADTARVLQELQADRQLPAALRAAAFRRSLTAAPADSHSRLVAVLAGDDWTFKQVALEALAADPAPERIRTVVEKLASWDAPTQAGAIAAIARSGSAAAVPAIVAASSHPSSEVRVEALTALGFLPGSREVVALLAKAATGDDDSARAARTSLARLNGPDVSAAILAGAERGDPSLRKVHLEQLALRHLTEGIPLLLQCRRDSDTGVRAAAVAALGELAPFSEQPAAIAWAIAATDDTESSRALRALINITLRSRDAGSRGHAVFAAIEAANPEVAVRLIPALPRLGGIPGAECAARLALRPSETVAKAATDALARWSDATALPGLATVAEKATVPSARANALDAALRSLDRDRTAWTTETTRTVSRLLAAAGKPAQRKQALALLARAKEPGALRVAEELRSDPVLGEDARYAAGAIKAALAGPPKLQASSDSGVANLTDGKTSTRWSTPLAGDEWISIDFRASRPLRRLTLDQTGRAGEYPEKYTVHVSDNAAQPGPAVVSGQGQRNRTVIDLPAGTQGRYVWIKNTAERKDTPWAVCELYVD